MACDAQGCGGKTETASLSLALSRRGVLKAFGMSAAGLVAAQTMPREAFAGPFTEEELAGHLIPADKKLSPAWIASLYERGKPEFFSGDELKYIGMPIGGIACGQLYLGGDGRLWLWDIFKNNYRREPDHGQRIDSMTLGGHYAHPIAFGESYNKHNGAQVEQGSAVRVRQNGKQIVKTLDRDGFPSVSFRGEYPVGKVAYQEDGFPVAVQLEAFSPFIPLNATDSAIPATVMRYTVSNTSDKALEVDLAGWLQNATCPYESDATLGDRVSRFVKSKGRVSLLGTIEPSQKPDKGSRKDIEFADFEGDDWGGWTAEGDAFEGGPFPVGELAHRQKVTGFSGKKFANSFDTRKVNDSDSPDPLTGTLTSAEFKIERKYVVMGICGGSCFGKSMSSVYAEIVVHGKSVCKISGDRSVAMKQKHMDVIAYEGTRATLRIVDEARNGWGHIAVDRIVFSDTAPLVATSIDKKHGYGSMALSLLHDAGKVAVAGVTALTRADSAEAVLNQLGDVSLEAVRKPLNESLVGALGVSCALEAGESKTLDFAIIWYFPDYHQIDEAPGQLSDVNDFQSLRRHYAPWFRSAGDVAQRLVDERERLIEGTLLWNKTWNDSSLPHWLLDRTFIALDCIATQTCLWFDSGRFWGWEGVDCCPGTCQHVWHYAQSLGRIFPEIERDIRMRVDFGSALHEDGGTGHRGPDTAGKYGQTVAHDGHCGRILGAYREHLTAADDQYLKSIYPKVKLAIEYLIRQDRDQDGLLEGAQHNTLDATWSGPMGWISSLYLGALAAGEAMAGEMDDETFAKTCRRLMDSGYKQLAAQVYDGEYFIHKSTNPKQLNSNKGCHIDQVLGQAWAWQVGLPRVVPKKETLSALRSLWKYNFTLDAGGYAMKHREIEQAFRWYAMPGEAGLLMCTWPKGGAKQAIPGSRLRAEKNPNKWTGPGGYFNECMNGFEYQVAAHMLYEGTPELIEHGLAITKAVHERYGAEKRSPYNEIECSDHYARSMASYGIFLAACGFDYHGPKGHLAFAPRLSPEDFKAPFTSAEGWGTFRQKVDTNQLVAAIDMKWGELALKTMALTLSKPLNGKSAAKVKVNGKSVPFRQQGVEVVLTLADDAVVRADETLNITVDC